MRREPPGRYFAVTWMPFTGNALAYSSEVANPEGQSRPSMPLTSHLISPAGLNNFPARSSHQGS